MTRDFVHGILVMLIPSMLTVAWLAWRAPSSEQRPDEF